MATKPSRNEQSLERRVLVLAPTGRDGELACEVLGSHGSLESKTDGLQSTVERNEDRQDSMQTRLDQMEKRLRAQYEALDTQMAALQGTSSYVTQMINSLS